MLIGEPKSVQDYKNRGLDREQIAEEFRKAVNGLYEKLQDYQSKNSTLPLSMR